MLQQSSQTRGIRDLLDRNPMEGEPRKTGRGYLWSTRELKLLDDNYPFGGVPVCLKVLKGRSATSIYNKAHQRNLAAPITVQAVKDGRKRNQWKTSPEIDRAITDGIPLCTQKRDVQRLAESLDRPRWWVSKRAMALGLVDPRFKEPEWTDAETEYVMVHAHRHPETIARGLKRLGFKRTATSIVVKRKRLQVTTKDPDHYTATGFSVVMGVDPGSVMDWIEKDWLVATRRGTKRVAGQGGDQHWIHRREARRFIRDHIAVIDIRKVDKVLFVELLTKGIVK